jgi:hypothetical protein
LPKDNDDNFEFHWEISGDYEGYWFIFSPDVSVSIQGSVTITGLTFEHKAGPFYAGVNQSALWVPGATLAIDIEDRSSPVSQGAYGGFTMYVYSVPAQGSVGEQEPQPQRYSNNHAKYTGGAVALFYANLAPMIIETEFMGNSATGEEDGYGGALYMETANNYGVLYRTSFRQNSVDVAGGAMAMAVSHFGTIIEKCEFIGNDVSSKAGTGGALWCVNLLRLCITQYP